jgi:sterol desaturase/sphingolipid hydroxylase (fatty acid hydroxylase superfamily)
VALIPRRFDERLCVLVRWGAYPVLLGTTVVIGTLALVERWPYQTTYGLMVLGVVAVLMTLEILFPYRDAWRMTKRSVLRDLKYITVGSIVVGLGNAFLGVVALALADRHTGPLAQAPLYLALPIVLLTFEGLSYAHPRLSHELPGVFGRFLWLTHVAHHLPDRVYVVMHAAFHPLNVVITQVVIMLLPLALLGVTPEVTLAFNLLVGFHTIISHCNVDIRAGWLNYVFIGTELHRFHHSADEREAKNYGAVLSLLDLAFGTFYYRPGTVPARLGVAAPTAYPDSNEFWRVLWLPFAGWKEVRRYAVASS